MKDRIQKTDQIIIDIDGVRVENEHGWFLMRASNTQNQLTCRAESTTKAGLQKLVKIIEDQSEVMVAYYLKNSFRLVEFLEPGDGKTAGNIELENIDNSSESKKILWKAANIFEKITKKRWILSISSKKGFKSLAELEKDENEKLIKNIKKEKIIKKILEIIPLSEVVSIEEVQFDELPKKKD